MTSALSSLTAVGRRKIKENENQKPHKKHWFRWATLFFLDWLLAGLLAISIILDFIHYESELSSDRNDDETNWITLAALCFGFLLCNQWEGDLKSKFGQTIDSNEFRIPLRNSAMSIGTVSSEWRTGRTSPSDFFTCEPILWRWWIDFHLNLPGNSIAFCIVVEPSCVHCDPLIDRKPSRIECCAGEISHLADQQSAMCDLCNSILCGKFHLLADAFCVCFACAIFPLSRNRIAIGARKFTLSHEWGDRAPFICQPIEQSFSRFPPLSFRSSEFAWQRRSAQHSNLALESRMQSTCPLTQNRFRRRQWTHVSAKTKTE